MCEPTWAKCARGGLHEEQIKVLLIFSEVALKRWRMTDGFKWTLYVSFAIRFYPRLFCFAIIALFLRKVQEECYRGEVLSAATYLLIIQWELHTLVSKMHFF